ncbi:hypothetical protein GCM10020331_066380 [Ectobacillus funiculus]
MDQQQWKTAKRIAATYIGTIVGAGFATGREIVEFFSRCTVHTEPSVFLASGIFIHLDWNKKMMLLAARIEAYSAQEFNKYLFGDVFGNIVNAVLLLFLLGTTSVMLSGAGAVFEEQLRLPRQFGILLTIVACLFNLNKGAARCFFEVNSLVVPIMMIFLLLGSTLLPFFTNMAYPFSLLFRKKAGIGVGSPVL